MSRPNMIPCASCGLVRSIPTFVKQEEEFNCFNCGADLQLAIQNYDKTISTEEDTTSQKTSEADMQSVIQSPNEKGTPFYLAIFFGIVFIIGLMMIYPDYDWWKQKQRGYWGHDDFSTLKNFMSGSSDGTAWVLGLGLCLLATIVATFAHLNQPTNNPSAIKPELKGTKSNDKESKNSEEPQDSEDELKSESETLDVEQELEKLKRLLDKDLITQEAYDAKMNQLLGL